MPVYLIERTHKKTGKTKIELVKAPFLSLAYLEQGMEYGEDYTYELAGRIDEVGKGVNLNGHNKMNKDRLDRFHQYQKAMAESSYTNPFTNPMPRRERII